MIQSNFIFQLLKINQYIEKLLYSIYRLPALYKDQHVKFLLKGIRNLPSAFEVQINYMN
jgi:hypothetical protein